MATEIVTAVGVLHLELLACQVSMQPRPQGLLLDDFQNGRSTIRHFENRRGEGS